MPKQSRPFLGNPWLFFLQLRSARSPRAGGVAPAAPIPSFPQIQSADLGEGEYTVLIKTINSSTLLHE